MKKKVLLLAVSCKEGGLCPGGLDLDDPSKWIRIVKDDGRAGAVQGHEIDFAKPLDIIEFFGRPMPQGVQKENWVIDKNSCKVIGSTEKSKIKKTLDWAYQKYSYHDFWGNDLPFLNEVEFSSVHAPSESILKVSNIEIYRNAFLKSKIDFNWDKVSSKIIGISMTDPDYFLNHSIKLSNAYIIASIPKELWVNPTTGKKQAYKFVSKIYEI